MTFHLERTLVQKLTSDTVSFTDHRGRVVFPQKLWEATSGSCSIIQWRPDGKAIIVKEDNFEKDIMKSCPELVQIPSFANFRRQMRAYGFNWARQPDGTFEFSHKYFLRDDRSLLKGIVSVVQRSLPKSTKNTSRGRRSNRCKVTAKQADQVCADLVDTPNKGCAKRPNEDSNSSTKRSNSVNEENVANYCTPRKSSYELSCQDMTKATGDAGSGDHNYHWPYPSWPPYQGCPCPGHDPYYYWGNGCLPQMCPVDPSTHHGGGCCKLYPSSLPQASFQQGVVGGPGTTNHELSPSKHQTPPSRDLEPELQPVFPPELTSSRSMNPPKLPSYPFVSPQPNHPCFYPPYPSSGCSGQPVGVSGSESIRDMAIPLHYHDDWSSSTDDYNNWSMSSGSSHVSLFHGSTPVQQVLPTNVPDADSVTPSTSDSCTYQLL